MNHGADDRRQFQLAVWAAQAVVPTARSVLVEAGMLVEAVIASA